MANNEEQKINLENDNTASEETAKADINEKEQNPAGENAAGKKDSQEPLMTEEQLEALKALNEHMQNLNDQILQAQEQAQKERARAEEYAKRLINLQAEFDNYRKRNAESVKTAQIEGRSQVLVEVIKILDIIEQAMSMIKDDATNSGIKLIYRQIESVLRNFEVEEIQAEKGIDFDPNLHSAVELVKAEDVKSGAIAEVVQKGYRLGEKILRHASVKVAQ
ncbi:MAG TPA: nucleotide exchange factor GrpE [Clostridia bacterium]